MAKRKKAKTGRVIMVSKEDNLLLKRIFIECDQIGITLTNSEICDQIFSIGISEKFKSISNDSNHGR